MSELPQARRRRRRRGGGRGIMCLCAIFSGDCLSSALNKYAWRIPRRNSDGFYISVETTAGCSLATRPTPSLRNEFLHLTFHLLNFVRLNKWFVSFSFSQLYESACLFTYCVCKYTSMHRMCRYISVSTATNSDARMISLCRRAVQGKNRVAVIMKNPRVRVPVWLI
jgi:hypothetical protein